jgi:predicted secreted protein
MGLVKGEDVILKFSDGDLVENEHIYCARSVTLDVQRDYIETSINSSGIFRTYTPTGITWSGTIEGLVYIADANIPTYGVTAYGLLNALINGANSITLEFYEEDMEHSKWTKKSGLIFIESVSETASFDNMTTFSVTFRGNGQLNLDFGDV